MKLSVFIFMGSLFLFSCKKDKTVEGNLEYGCSSITVSYFDDIVPLISQSCATNQGPGTGCHDAWIFEYPNVQKIAENGTLRTVCVDSKYMPPIPNNFGIEPLTDDEIQLFSCWIYQGAQNN